MLCVFQAVQDLTRDNLTEHPLTVNVLSRMNIYQEVFLAAVYRLLPALHVQFILCLFLAICLMFLCCFAAGNYFRHDGCYARSVWLSVILSFCLCAGLRLILLKLGVTIESTNRKNWLTGGDPVPNTDSRSLFHFCHHCGIGDFRRFISIQSYILCIHIYFSYRHDTWWNDWHWRDNESTTCWE